MSEYTITIAEIVDDVVWIQLNIDGKPVFKEPLAAALRQYLEAGAAHAKDAARGDGWNTETAFEKVKISAALDSELMRA